MGKCGGGHSLLAHRLCDPGWAFAALGDFENQPDRGRSSCLCVPDKPCSELVKRWCAILGLNQ